MFFLCPPRSVRGGYFAFFFEGRERRAFSFQYSRRSVYTVWRDTPYMSAMDWIVMPRLNILRVSRLAFGMTHYAVDLTECQVGR